MSEEKVEYAKPLPDFRPETKPFWDGTKEHKLLLPKCKETGKVFFYPRANTPGCTAEACNISENYDDFTSCPFFGTPCIWFTIC